MTTVRGIDYRIRKIVSGDSTAHGALQLADMIGGAAVEAWKRGVQETPLLRIVRGKVMIEMVTSDMEKPATQLPSWGENSPQWGRCPSREKGLVQVLYASLAH